MVITTILKGFAGVLVAGTAIGVPAYMATKSNGTSSSQNNPVVSQTQPSSQADQLPKTVPTPQERMNKEEKHDHCLDRTLDGLQVRVTDNQEKRTFVVSVSDAGRYSDRNRYSLDANYSGQCKIEEK